MPSSCSRKVTIPYPVIPKLAWEASSRVMIQTYQRQMPVRTQRKNITHWIDTECSLSSSLVRQARTCRKQTNRLVHAWFMERSKRECYVSWPDERFNVGMTREVMKDVVLDRKENYRHPPCQSAGVQKWTPSLGRNHRDRLRLLPCRQGERGRRT